jgi:hypothetical protein
VAVRVKRDAVMRRVGIGRMGREPLWDGVQDNAGGRVYI